MDGRIKIQITFHAEERLLTRLGVKKHKMYRVAWKALHCRHWDQWRYKKLEYQLQFREDAQFVFYRQMLGKIWVWRKIAEHTYRLITIY